MATTSPPRPSRMLRLQAVLDRTGLGRSTIYEKIRAGEFPAPFKLTSLLNGWKEEEVEAWIESRTRSETIGPGADAPGEA